ADSDQARRGIAGPAAAAGECAWIRPGFRSRGLRLLRVRLCFRRWCPDRSGEGRRLEMDAALDLSSARAVAPARAPGYNEVNLRFERVKEMHMARALSWRPVVWTLVVWIYQVAWAVWFGGIVTLGAVSAPGIFRSARQWPEPETAPLVYRFAGVAAGGGFWRVNTLSLACGVVRLLAGGPGLHA